MGTNQLGIIESIGCPACDATYSIYIREFPLNDNRRPKTSSLYGCFFCQSAYFRHLPRSSATTAWSERVRDRNTLWSAELYSKLKSKVDLSHIIDVGCGIGTWLQYASQHGSTVLGYDSNPVLVEYGIKKYKINLTPVPFASSNPLALKKPATLLTAIMVFEHLLEPRILAKEISEYCKRMKAKAFVAVPFFTEKKYSELLESSNYSQTIFNDTGADVTYFSERGLIAMFKDCGMKSTQFLSAGGWRGCLFEP
jgi:2-polyprenyl-3-methyl-5-hydroxy-6-metoxy-1,4-benzoquinol methylase